MNKGREAIIKAALKYAAVTQLTEDFELRAVHEASEQLDEVLSEYAKSLRSTGNGW